MSEFIGGGYSVYAERDAMARTIDKLERKINYLESQLKIQTEACQKAEADLAFYEDKSEWDDRIDE